LSNFEGFGRFIVGSFAKFVEIKFKAI